MVNNDVGAGESAQRHLEFHLLRPRSAGPVGDEGNAARFKADPGEGETSGFWAGEASGHW
jgi:hypothetical protein